MNDALKQGESGRSFFERVLFGFFLFFLFVIPLFVTTLIDETEDKWFLIRVVGPTLLVLLVIYLSGKEIGRPHLDGLVVFAVAWLAFQLFSLLDTANMGVSLGVITRQVGLLSFFFVARYFSRDFSAIVRIGYVLVLVGFATSVYGVAQHFGYDFIHWQRHSEVPIERGVSFMGHATFAASVLVMLIPISVMIGFVTNSRLGRIAMGVSGLVMLYHLSFTGARVANVALFLSAAVTTLAYFGMAWADSSRIETDSKEKRASVESAGLALLMIGLVGSVFVYLSWSIKGSDVLGLLEGGLAQRIYAWETANRIFVAHPLNGIGVGNYEIVSPEYWNVVEASRFAQFQRSLYQPHNEYFEAAAESGLPGVASVLGVIVLGLVQCFARTRLPRVVGACLFAAILGSAMDAFFLFPWQIPESALIFWVVLGVVSGQRVLNDSESEPEAT